MMWQGAAGLSEEEREGILAAAERKMQAQIDQKVASFKAELEEERAKAEEREKEFAAQMAELVEDRKQASQVTGVRTNRRMRNRRILNRRMCQQCPQSLTTRS